ncbi:transposase [Schlegelella sp. S2-27]|uniref:Transposase n=1 Tax=Caldimonas mangrovi TaxID=2944811 RepID=A0ABT0YIT4_9BURK|nr:transposase [Caldimonas mangrovi]MCM5678583.1 transposase [Caldimonas mangrovi]
MARLPRLTVPGHPHLIVQRGHNRQTVFETEADYRTFLDTLREYAVTYGLSVHAYALLPAEVLLLATPLDNQALSRTMQSLGRRYVAWYNRRHGRTGALWEGRFRAGLIEARSAWLACTVFVEAAPQRRGHAAHAEHWHWSSFPHHSGRRVDPVVVEHALWWELGNTPFDREAAYRQRFEQGLSAAETQRIEDAATRGWALGSGAFLAGLSRQIARPLTPRPRGRPRKTKESVPI